MVLGSSGLVLPWLAWLSHSWCVLYDRLGGPWGGCFSGFFVGGARFAQLGIISPGMRMNACISPNFYLPFLIRLLQQLIRSNHAILAPFSYPFHPACRFFLPWFHIFHEAFAPFHALGVLPLKSFFPRMICSLHP